MYSVSISAVLQRLNRKLGKEYLKVCKSRGWRERQNLGEYHLLDVSKNTVIDWYIDPIELAKEKNVIAPFETVIVESNLQTI